MACRILGGKPLSKPMLGYCHWTLSTNFSGILIKVQKNIDENAYEMIVCEMAGILPKGGTS